MNLLANNRTMKILKRNQRRKSKYFWMLYSFSVKFDRSIFQFTDSFLSSCLVLYADKPIKGILPIPVSSAVFPLISK